MASNKLKDLTITFTARNAIKRGPTSSSDYNASFKEVSRDLANIRLEWNNKLTPLLDLLPDSTNGTDNLDAYTAGLDGRTMFAHSAATEGSLDTDRYYNSNKSRPNSIWEQLEAIYERIKEVEESLEAQVEDITST